jgi:hypothetical protein
MCCLVEGAAPAPAKPKRKCSMECPPPSIHAHTAALRCKPRHRSPCLYVGAAGPARNRRQSRWRGAARHSERGPDRPTPSASPSPYPTATHHNGYRQAMRAAVAEPAVSPVCPARRRLGRGGGVVYLGDGGGRVLCRRRPPAGRSAPAVAWRGQMSETRERGRGMADRAVESRVGHCGCRRCPPSPRLSWSRGPPSCNSSLPTETGSGTPPSWKSSGAFRAPEQVLCLWRGQRSRAAGFWAKVEWEITWIRTGAGRVRPRRRRRLELSRSGQALRCSIR